MKHSNASVGLLVVTPAHRVARITHLEAGSGKAWLDYAGLDSHLGGVVLDPKLLREASPRELLAAGIEEQV